MNMGNMNQMLKMAQKMQQDIARVQEEAASRTVESSAGGGAVRATVNGRKELVELVIDPQILAPEDVDMVVDLVVAAVNQALRQAEEMMAEAMAKVTGGLRLPF
jgi:DNA-binding YbaB/EbfC family protein